jgi:hypothetical protein
VTTLIDVSDESSERALSFSLRPVHCALRVVLSPGSLVAAYVNAQPPRLWPSLLQMAPQSNSFGSGIAK